MHIIYIRGNHFEWFPLDIYKKIGRQVKTVAGEVVVELKNITKEFPGVKALDNMQMTLRAGEIHGLIGENGAGKSTLIKMLTGVYTPNSGTIIVNGEEFSKINGPADAVAKGIACVYQELNMVKMLSVTDNMFLGNYVKSKSGFLNYRYMNKRTAEVLEGMGQKVNVRQQVGRLGMGQQQMIEIGKSILREAKVLILDEPTSSLGEREADELFRLTRELKEQGMAIVFISHKLEELFELCDVITVMRDGQYVSTHPTSEITNDSLIADMVGRPLDDLYPKVESEPGEVVLEVSDISKAGKYKNVSFQARRGEILGFSGLVGAGRTEVMQGVFGAVPVDSGEITVLGKSAVMKSPKDGITNKIAFLTEDRKAEGLILGESIEKNISIVDEKALSGGAFLNFNKLKAQANQCVEDLSIKTPTIEKKAGELSGGNQQKVVIGKWTVSDSEIYIFDEPTRGVDVGAKIQIYDQINKLIEQNKAVIMVSSDLPEVLGMSDRVIVMREGVVMGEVLRDSEHFNQEDIMKLSWGEEI